jgi:sarcosine oxidase
MEHIETKHVIVGAGAMGSATAYHLARRGEPLMLVEQFALGHDRGSSHGAARITRHSYADPRYARLMPAAFRAWKDLEADAGESVYFRTGGVSFSPAGVTYAAQVAANLQQLGVPFWRSTGRHWNARNSAFALPNDYDVVFEPDSGMLAAARALVLQIELAHAHAGKRMRVLAQTPVRRIDLDGARPVIVTDHARIKCERVIVSAGAWVKHLLPALRVPLRVTRQQVLYVETSDPAPFQIGRFPVFIYKGETELDAFYGMPRFQDLGVKVARHGGPEFDPDNNNRSISAEYVEIVRGFLRRHVPGLACGEILFHEVCLYTSAPGDQFVVEFLPERSDVIVASPCSGHGFKFSCLIGRALADLAVTGTTDISFERML